MARCSSNVNIYLYVTVDIIIIEKALTKIQLIQVVVTHVGFVIFPM